MPRVAFRNFTGGEVTPTLSARYDLQKFGSFLQCCENFIPNLHGDIERRPGMRFIAELGGKSVLIPFQFNTEPDNNYVLIFREGSITVASADGLLAGVSIKNPYTLDDVYALSTAQAGDIVYLAHKNYALRKLIRSGAAPDYEWALEEVALNQSIAAPTSLKASFVRDNADDDAPLNYTLRYVVTSVDEDGVESVASAVGATTGKYPTDWVVGNHVDLTWTAVEGAEEYNVYRESAGYYGLIGVASGKDATGGTLTGLRMGEFTTGIVKYSGGITRHIVISNGATTGFPPRPVEDKDETSPLNVTASPNQNAFLVDGKLFVWTEKTTTKEVWRYVQEWDPDSGANLSHWTSDTTVTTDKFWAMADCPSDNPAGTYAAYQTGSLGSNAAYPSGTVGAFTVSPVFSAGTTLHFTDQNFEPDTATTPKEDWNPFEDGNNPATVAFHQQRLVLGGTKDDPASFFMSRTGDYENFRKSRPLQDDDPVEYMLASGSIDEIRWMASFGDLLIGTSGAEYKATSSGAAITSSDVQISVQSYWGSSGLAPLIIGQSVMHCQRSGSHVRDLYYSWESDGYAGNDLSLLAPQLVESHHIMQWAFQQSPGSNIWAVRDDGVLLCLTYMKEQNVYGWSRHVTQGKALSVAVISGSQEDVVMLVVEREMGGVKKYFLERLAGRFRDADGIVDAFYVDCGLTSRQETASDTVVGLGHLEGADVVALADGSPVEGLTVADGAVTLPYAAKVVTVGLNYVSALSPLPLETDTQQGATLGKRRAYGKCVLRLYRSVGGKYAATEPGDLFDVAGWKDRTAYDLPFLPEKYGEACQPFSGNIEISLPSGQDADTSLWLMQDRPMPFRVVAIMADVDFGEV